MSLLFPKVEGFVPKLTRQTIRHKGEFLNLYQHIEGTEYHVLSIKNFWWEDFWWCRDLFAITVKEPDFVIDLRALSPRQYRYELYSMFNVQLPTVEKIRDICPGLAVQTDDTLNIYSSHSLLDTRNKPLFQGILAESREGVLHVCEWYTTTGNLNAQS